MTAIVAVDVGGTHARFAIAEVRDGRVLALGEAVTLKTAEHASFQTAWQEFERVNGAPLPRGAAIAIAGPVDADVIKLTNNPWIIRRSMVCEKLDVDSFVIVNDFGAVGHAVAQAGPEHFQHLTGPDQDGCANGTAGYRSNAWCLDQALSISTKRLPGLRGVRSSNMTTRPCGKWACQARTALPPQRLTASVYRLAVWQATLRSRREGLLAL